MLLQQLRAEDVFLRLALGGLTADLLDVRREGGRARVTMGHAG